MSQFYARYVPPAKEAQSQNDDVAKASPATNKRKREEDAPKQREKQLKRSDPSRDAADTSAKANAPKIRHHERDSSATTSEVILEKYRITAAKSEAASAEVRKRSKGSPRHNEGLMGNSSESKLDKNKKKQTQSEKSDKQETVMVKEEESSGNRHIPDQDKVENRKKKRPRKTDDEQAGKEEVPAEVQKHASVLAKFQKAKQQDHQETKQDTALEEPPPELHGLEPLPQPVHLETVPEKLTYSVLPQWQANPVMVPSKSDLTFDSYNLSETLMGNLRKQGLITTLPIQSTVLALLLNGPTRHTGDLCVSAATGSGKTLSYVLPIIADLQELPGTKLRAVIVVPTRELVKQVRELCESCSAGTSLKFATAVGSKSLSEEQDTLVKEEQIYDPDEYEEWQQRPVDWSTFSLTKLAQIAKHKDPLESVGYMMHHRSKVDVLITTPGRLVDHLGSTPGFTLDHVRWLVVDEADRLLNESYQEWAAVVKPALESQAATKRKDELLRYMGMTPPRRQVTKVLLSATMTRDLTKLNALGLHNPKLVLLGGNEEDNRRIPSSDAGIALPNEGNDKETFRLPDTLKETAVPISDGSEKPLILLELVKKHFGIYSVPSKPVSDARVRSGSESDSTSASSSDSEETSSSDETSSASESSSASEGTPRTKEVATSKLVVGKKHVNAPRALIFARSTASAERLFRLMCLLDPPMAPWIATLTRSTASSASSRRALASFRTSRISVLIATDRASRGLDVPGLEHVVSYDVPNSALTYVHRVGRTARAGKGGHAWTIVEHREGAWFWREIGGKRQQTVSGPAPSEIPIQRTGRVSKLHLSLEQTDLKQRYKEALRQLGDEVLGRPS